MKVRQALSILQRTSMLVVLFLLPLLALDLAIGWADAGSLIAIVAFAMVVLSVAIAAAERLIRRNDRSPSEDGDAGFRQIIQCALNRARRRGRE